MTWINYNLHNKQGERIGEVRLPAKSYERIVIEDKGIHYTPIKYCLMTKSAVCVPVKHYSVREDNHETTARASRKERQLVLR